MDMEYEDDLERNKHISFFILFFYLSGKFS